MFTDTHCHILKESYNNIDEVLANALAKGVNRYIVGAYNYLSSKEVIDLTFKYPSFSK